MPEIEIRDNPKLSGLVRNVSETSFTGLMWGIWLYLLLPVLNILLWYMGIRVFYVEVIEDVGYMELLGLINKMGWTVITVFLALRLWGYYNYIRFGRKNRRRGTLPVTIEKLAEHYNIPVEDIKTMQSEKEVDWHHVK